MSESSPSPAGERLIQIRVPCQESCVFFRPLVSGRWAEYGLCQNPVSPLRGYPARLDRECRYFRSRQTPVGRQTT